MVEWKESLLQRLAGDAAGPPPLLPAVYSSDATHNVCRFLTSLHGVPLAAQDLDKRDDQGTLTLWFHEILGKDGKPSDKVFGVTNCHVLRKDTTVEYEHRGGAAIRHVRVCGNRRFDRGFNETTDEIANRAMAAEILAREMANFQAKEQTTEVVRAIEKKQWSLDRETQAETTLWAFHADARLNWLQTNLHRNIGYTQFAPAITVNVEGGTRFTSDWGVFAATEGKVEDAFEGNVVYLMRFNFFVSYSPHTTSPHTATLKFFLGAKYTAQQLNKMFYPIGGGQTTFKFPEGKFRIEGWSTLDELAAPDDIYSEHQHFVVVGKDGNTTDLTVGRYAGLVSFTENDAGVTSIEIGIYTGEKLQANIKAKFPHADFFRTAW